MLNEQDREKINRHLHKVMGKHLELEHTDTDSAAYDVTEHDSALEAFQAIQDKSDKPA